MMLSAEKRVRFSIGGRADCAHLHFAIPDTAWVSMEGGLSQEFNLVLIGIPLMAAVALVRDREEALSALRQHVVVQSTSDFPHIRESEIICAVGNFEGQPMVILLVTRRGRKAVEAGRRHEFDLRPAGLPLRVFFAGFPTHEQAAAHCMSMTPEGVKVLDVSEHDLTIAPFTQTKH